MMPARCVVCITIRNTHVSNSAKFAPQVRPLPGCDPCWQRIGRRATDLVSRDPAAATVASPQPRPGGTARKVRRVRVRTQHEAGELHRLAEKLHECGLEVVCSHLYPLHDLPVSEAGDAPSAQSGRGYEATFLAQDNGVALVDGTRCSELRSALGTAAHVETDPAVHDREVSVRDAGSPAARASLCAGTAPSTATAHGHSPRGRDAAHGFKQSTLCKDAAPRLPLAMQGARCPASFFRTDKDGAARLQLCVCLCKGTPKCRGAATPQRPHSARVQGVRCS